MKWIKRFARWLWGCFDGENWNLIKFMRVLRELEGF